MKKVMVVLFILLSFSLGFADEQEKKEQKVFTDKDLNQYRSPNDSPSKDKKSSPSEGVGQCKWMLDKLKECTYEGDEDKGRICTGFWGKKFRECLDDSIYGPPVRVRIVPR